MRIPKKIDKLLTKQTELLVSLHDTFTEIQNFLERNHVEIELDTNFLSSDFFSNPYNSSYAIRTAILNKEKSFGQPFSDENEKIEITNCARQELVRQIRRMDDDEFLEVYKVIKNM